MTTEDIKRLFHVDDIRLMPEAIMRVITGDKEHRDEVYKELLSINGRTTTSNWRAMKRLARGILGQLNNTKKNNI